MISQIYFLKCLQISSTQIKHTYNYSAAVKLLVIWNSISYLKTRKEKKKSKSPPVDPLWLQDKIQSQPCRTRSGIPWLQRAERVKRGLSARGSCESLTGRRGNHPGITRWGRSQPRLSEALVLHLLCAGHCYSNGGLEGTHSLSRETPWCSVDSTPGWRAEAGPKCEARPGGAHPQCGTSALPL